MSTPAVVPGESLVKRRRRIHWNNAAFMTMEAGYVGTLLWGNYTTGNIGIAIVGGLFLFGMVIKHPLSWTRPGKKS